LVGHGRFALVVHARDEALGDGDLTIELANGRDSGVFSDERRLRFYSDGQSGEKTEAEPFSPGAPGRGSSPLSPNLETQDWKLEIGLGPTTSP